MSNVHAESPEEVEPAGVSTDWRYAPIPEALLYDATLSPQAMRVYGCLLRHGTTPDHCFPSHARIAEKLGLSERSIARPVTELERAGWISRTRRHNYRGDRIADGYHVHTDAKARAESRSPTPLSSAGPARDVARDHRAESRGLEKQREPGEREPVNERADGTAAALPEKVSSSPYLPAAMRLCGMLSDQLQERGYKANADSVRWLTDMEALLRIDGRTENEVRLVLTWLHDGRDRIAEFWRTNVRSPATLRARWVQIGEQYRAARRPAGKASPLNEPGAPRLSDVLDQMKALEEAR